MKFVRIGPDDAALFDAQVKNEYAFVKFYSPGCFHCNEMAAAWDALEMPTKRGDQNRANVFEVHVGAIQNIKSACAKNVGGFPTIMAVRPGGFVMREYFGPRDTKSFLNFIRKTFPRRTMNVGRKTKSRRKTKTKRKMKTKRKTERKANKVVERKKPVYKKRKVASTTKRNIRIKR
tara:strand:+ start:315 stop:842 length:528 start_codon:yes stop_codon:yes gene_type:complete